MPDTQKKEETELPLRSTRDLPDRYVVDGNTLRDTSNNNAPVPQCRPGYSYYDE